MTLDPGALEALEALEGMRREAEDEIETWLCALDEQYKALLRDAEREAERLRAEATDDATEIVAQARAEAERILAHADELAGEHLDVIRALTEAEREAVGEELAGLREAVSRLRTELSRVVDAAFDAIPAVEATADAIDRAIESEPVKRGLLRRLLRR
jgi:F0F1-type ATP synthase membrane subunit b/b'